MERRTDRDAHRLRPSGAALRRAALAAAAVLVLAARTPCATAAFPLRDMAVADSIDLSGEWRYAEDPNDAGAAEGWYAQKYDRSRWRTTTVPFVWGQKPGRLAYPVYAGIAWYSRTVAVPARWTGETAIVFLGSMYVTDVWVNEKYAGIRRGGYSPFTLPLTRGIGPGGRATIVVRVDNRLSAETIPGKNLGWNAYGGLYREVYLVHRPRVRPEEIATRTAVPEGGPAVLTVSGEMRNLTPGAYRGTISAEVLSESGVVGAGSATVQIKPGGATPFSISCPVANARLWSPDDPYLHTLRIAWSAGERRTVEFPVGLRQFSVRGGRIHLNNRPIWLQGFGNHEEWPGFGPCPTDEMRLSDLAIMKNVYRANAFRPGHYPNHPRLYDMCDRLGIVVHPEIPSWQIRNTFADTDAAWQFWYKPQLADMVSTLRNHACVAFWGISNEQYGTPLYNERASAFVREMDRSRFLTIVSASASDLENTRLVDVLARNFHYGWYHSKSVYDIRSFLPRVVEAAGRKPIWVAELGAHAAAGRLDGGYGDQSRGSETYQDAVVRFGFQYCATETDAISGISVWTLADFHRADAVTPHGVMNEHRRPKLLASTLANLMRGDLRLFVCEENALCPAGGTWKASLRYFNPGGGARPGLAARWKIVQGTAERAAGRIAFDVPADSVRGQIGTVSWTAPADEPALLHTFWVELIAADGAVVYTNSSPFDVGTPSKPGTLSVRCPDADGAYAVIAGVRIAVPPVVGLIIPAAPGAYTVRVGAPGRREIVRDVSVAAGEAAVVSAALPPQTGEAGPP